MEYDKNAARSGHCAETITGNCSPALLWAMMHTRAWATASRRSSRMRGAPLLNILQWVCDAD
jgi:hypothetical protein